MTSLLPDTAFPRRLFSAPHDRRRPPRHRLESDLSRPPLPAAARPGLLGPPAELGARTERGVRITGPAAGAPRYSGGTGAPGGLTELGRQLLKAMRRKHVILDLSHMADQSVADAFATWRGPIMASHSNPRALVPGDRQVTDETVAEIARRGGMVGVSFYQHHLRPSGRATLNDVVNHIVHHARSAGGPEPVGLGTDLDGGFDARHAPIDSL